MRYFDTGLLRRRRRDPTLPVFWLDRRARAGQDPIRPQELVNESDSYTNFFGETTFAKNGTMSDADKKRPRFIIPLEDVVATVVIITVLAAVGFIVTRILT